MKTKRGIFILALVLAGALFWASSASAAIDNVRCILWQGDTDKYHTAISGQSVRLKGVINTDNTSTIWYKWIFGDGSASSVASTSGSTKYNIGIDHTYTGAVGTPFTAKLQVDAVDASMANAVEDTYLVKIEEPGLGAKVNLAIDNGLWWLYQQNYSHSSFHTFDGSPFVVFYNGNGSYPDNFFASPTASSIHAFAINNHKISGDTNEDPYVEAVQLGMNWLIQGYYANSSYPMLLASTITQQTAGNPDSNSNGVGIGVRDYAYSPIYESGQIMDAIIASGVSPAGDTGRDFTGRGSNWTYGELLQDMCDMYAYGQSESGSYRGGWQYNWNAYSDNSAAQWAAIGMIPAQQAPWNCVVPDWVKTENAIWLTYSFYVDHFGYTSANYQHDYYHNTTPSGMVQMNMDGQVGYDDPTTPTDERDPKWIACERYIADNWNRFLTMNSYSWGGPLTYGWYAFAKAMRLAVPQPVERITTTAGTAFDWYTGSDVYQGLAPRIVESQYADGYWNGSLTSTSPLTTAWMVIILRPALFQAAPIACFTADPNPTYPDGMVEFDPACSDHSETGKDIGNLVLFEWDWDNDGTYDASSTTPQIMTHSFPCTTLPCSYPVTLRVTDDGNPAIKATFSLNVDITNPPHPPVAKAGGPYMVSLCAGDELNLDGSGSFDPNEGTSEAGCTTCPGDTITSWDWDLTPPLTGFDDGTGETVTLDSTAIANYFTAGIHGMGLQVTDNTLLSFPGSGDPNLTDADFVQVTVWNSCGACDLYARAKDSKIQLTWSPGAASYDVYRSTTGPNGPFDLIADDHVTDYATYLDTNVVNGTTYYYRVVDSDGCGSKAANAIPTARLRTR